MDEEMISDIEIEEDFIDSEDLENEEAGEGISLATVASVTASGVTLIIDGEEEAGEKEYKVNAMQRITVGDRVRIFKVSGTYLIEYVVGAPMQRFPIPAGGSDGQVLVKDGSADYVVKWSNASHGLPAGGTAGQVLVKSSRDDYAVSWADPPHGVPSGGSKYQVLTKNSASDYDLKWTTPESTHGIPSGGSTGQVLAKKNNTNYEVEWVTPSVGLLKNGSYTLTLNSSGQLVPNSSGSVSMGTSQYPIGNLYTNGYVQLGANQYNARLGFFGTTPISKVTTITTSSSLSNLIQALKNYGLL